ncbi:ATPase [Alterinioella nitratireducens]|uniref:ATPase n=1 Tax=Alterinioella nitratireducens TaxID=2735915 RepID=UPI001552F5EA|nr:ATPase [Alterinioella nitratireducens]NPD18365.1 ATPase [Alterinioella nitratireducens]
MIYETARDWIAAPDKRVLFFGMSGLGKTHLANLLRAHGDWFHYSVDYRIGTAYMGEHITDNLKRQAMTVPFLATLLRSDSIYIGSNITFNNLAPLSSYLGKPGDPAKGGLPFSEYMRRQDLHRRAEINALLDTPQFIARAHDLYGYEHFVCDTGGSICEVVDPENPADEVLRTLGANTLMVWIEGSGDHTEELIRRFDKSPKPMYYQPRFMRRIWDEFKNETNTLGGDVDPDAFVRYAYGRALRHRAPLYAAMARNWGVTVQADDVAKVRDCDDVIALVADALATRPN